MTPNGKPNGWGRFIYQQGTCSIGWHKNGCAHGNRVDIYGNGEIMREGWYDTHKYIGDYKKEADEYKFFKAT